MKAARLDRASAGAERLRSVREDERRRLARDLHDGPAQSLAAALFGVDLAIRALGSASDPVREELLVARELVRDALDDLRAMMAGLRPRHLEERGLPAALEHLAATPPLWGPRVHVEAPRSGGENLPADVALGLYRIAQEAVSNARRHSGATQVTVSLRTTDDAVILEIRDDGCGFALSDVRPGDRRGEGIPGMRERTSMLGGELTVASDPDRGTRVTASVPLDRSGWERETGEEQ